MEPEGCNLKNHMDYIKNVLRQVLGEGKKGNSTVHTEREREKNHNLVQNAKRVKGKEDVCSLIKFNE